MCFEMIQDLLPEDTGDVGAREKAQSKKKKKKEQASKRKRKEPKQLLPPEYRILLFPLQYRGFPIGFNQLLSLLSRTYVGSRRCVVPVPP
jgi:hypothetical protein